MVSSSSSSSSSSFVRVDDLKEVFLRFKQQQLQQQRSDNDRFGATFCSRNLMANSKHADVENSDTIHSVASIASVDEEGWDETMVDENGNNPASFDWQQSFVSKSDLLTPHVFAHQSWVCGIHECNDVASSSDINTSTMSIRWKTSLAPHRILQVASNVTGTVIAATTDQGMVSIMRGRDGKILATRRVHVAPTGSPMSTTATTKMVTPLSPSTLTSAAQLSFVVKPSSNNEKAQQQHDRDALLVFSSEHSGPALLVSNIQGDAFNDERDGVLARATQAMTLHAVQIPTVASEQIYDMKAYFVGDEIDAAEDSNIYTIPTDLEATRVFATKIRIIFIHGESAEEGKLGRADYDLNSQTCHLFERDILSRCFGRLDLVVDGFAGIQMKSLPPIEASGLQNRPQMISAFVGHTKPQLPALYWMNPDSLPSGNVLGSHPLSSSSRGTSSMDDCMAPSYVRVPAIKFTNTANPNETVAILAVLRGEQGTEIQILQSRFGYSSEEIESTSLWMGPVHQVYAVPVPSDDAIRSISLAPLLPALFGPYSFRAKASIGLGRQQRFFVFQTANNSHDGSAVGTIRSLAAKGEFHEARALVHQVGMEILMNDQYANFHPSEIALQRLVSLLRSTTLHQSDATTMPWLESLDIIERGSGHPEGRRVLLRTASIFLDWPNVENEASFPSISQVVVVLLTVLTTIKNVSEAFSGEEVHSFITEKYQEKVVSLEEKLTAVKYLETILRDEASAAFSPQSVPLNADFAGVRSVNDLFSCFVQNGYFSAAEQLWRSNLRFKLSSEDMVAALLQIRNTVHPKTYSYLLQEIVVSSLSINHELLPACLAWCCRMADDFDDTFCDGDGLERAIFLLQTVEQATKRLSVKIHSSFAHYSPFVERVSTGKESKGRKPKVTSSEIKGSLFPDASTTNESFFFGNDISGSPMTVNRLASSNIGDAGNVEWLNPTILEFGHMKQGAQKARLGLIPSLRSDAFDINEGSVEMKLQTARCLQLARSLGIDEGLVKLRNFVYCGGAQYVAKELVRFYSIASESHDQRRESVVSNVKRFCDATPADFDEALLAYSKELCGAKTTNKGSIEEAASIARCCETSTSKCKITLTVLRAALFYHFSPNWMTQLSRDAIEWAAGDTSVRTELEEASRLLLIDEIVGRYCGNGAKELFHVDNPLHPIRLLEFVVGHIDHESVLSDVTSLCEAFHHLSEEHGCSVLVQNAILKGNSKRAEYFLASLYDRNEVSAHNIFSKVVAFCLDIIEEQSYILGTFREDFPVGDYEYSLRQNDLEGVTLCARALTRIALQYSGFLIISQFGDGYTTFHYDKPNLEQLSYNLERLQTLQSDHGIFLSLSSLDNPATVVAVTQHLFSKIAVLYEEGEIGSVSSLVTHAKRAVVSLSGSPCITESDLTFSAALPPACLLARATKGLEALNFISNMGVLKASKNECATRCCVAVAWSYCMKASNSGEVEGVVDRMKGMVKASSLLQDYVLGRCASMATGAVMDIASVCDIASRAMTRADEGVGEALDSFRQNLLENATERMWTLFDLSEQQNKHIGIESLRLSQPSLHPSWFVGDGLLLPPEEVLVKGTAFCKQCLGLCRWEVLLDEGIQNLVASRGSHALALQIMAHSVLVQCCQTGELVALEELCNQVHIALAERYLGGTSNGITSGIVDSQLAVSFILSLPLKLAFQIYRSSLPNAITTRDFTRVVVLANIGKEAGSSKGNHWTRQSKFIAQCERLATKATWWKVLDESDVPFDPHLFQDTDGESNTTSTKRISDMEGFSLDGSYAASMVPAFIDRRVAKGGGIEQIVAVLSNFADAFGLPRDYPIRCCVQYLLSPSDNGYTEHPNLTFHRDTIRVEASLAGIVKSLVRRLDSAFQRVDVLRMCLIRFERSEPCVDYERLSVILMMYQAELAALLSKEESQAEGAVKNLMADMELVDRRRDALAILMSFYRDGRKDQRPAFSGFFLPMSETLSRKSSQPARECKCNILGWVMERDEDSFDPLSPLERTLRSARSPAVTSALSPLCVALGVPRGYIRARSLIARFTDSKSQAAALPSFDDDVLPVLNQLRASSDVAEVANWCSKQYQLQDPDKLKCLDHALTHAVKASNETESRRGDEVDLSFALGRVKMISSAKDLLSDRLAVSKIFKSAGKSSAADERASFSRLLGVLADKLEAEVWGKENPSFIPEHFVNVLLEEASLIAAEAALSEDESISVGQLRRLSHLVYQVCNYIAEKYSHVQIGFLARRLTGRWLIHGDGENVASIGSSKDMIPVLSKTEKFISDIHEDDTMIFELDLSAIGAGVSSATTSKPKEKRSSEEETSAIKPTAAREMSELASHRSSLRVAFVMAFADGYYGPSPNDGNLNDATNEKAKAFKTQPRGLLSKVQSTRTKDQHAIVLEHCRDLLRVIFAKSNVATRVMRGLNTTIDSISVAGMATRKSPDTITFAMRHRCLRTASILVPQQALEEVLEEEEFLPHKSSSTSSLHACSFGTFVAKEVEEMGLPIPHSDLFQLSQMHFPSYARALWRHHRDIKGAKGRLLLLIIEMYLKETISDTTFFLSILKEIESLGLPRTLLLALECTVRSMERAGPDAARVFVRTANQELTESLTKLSRLIHADLKQIIDGDNLVDQYDRSCVCKTLNRLAFVLGACLDAPGICPVWMTFCQGIFDLDIYGCGILTEEGFGELYTILYLQAGRHGSKGTRKELQDFLLRLFPKTTATAKIPLPPDCMAAINETASNPLASFLAHREAEGTCILPALEVDKIF